MRVINSILDSRNLIENLICSYGDSSEHNFWYYYNMKEEGVRPAFFIFEEKYGLFALYYEDENEFEVISDVLAPKEKRLNILLEFIDYSLKSSEKLFLTLEKEFRRKFLDKIDQKRYNVHKPTRVFDSPVFNMKDFDSSLPGKGWKKIRNINNAFFRENDVEIKDFDKKDKESIKKVVIDWEKTRKSSVAKAWAPIFLNFVENDFKGCDMRRIIYVNKEPCAITAGWKIPNKNAYYSSIGIHNYKYKGIGEVAYVDDLRNLKEKKYDLVDFGGSEKKNLLNFKLKFNPHSMEKYYFFRISKIQDSPDDL